MNIIDGCVATLTWVLKDGQNEVLDELTEPVAFMVGGHDLLPRLDQALQGHGPGAVLELHLEPQQAFGDYDGQRVFLEPRSRFPEGIEEGMVFEGRALPAGCDPDIAQDALLTITEIYPEHVVLDGNHPLAGMALRLRLKVHAVRPATPDEQASGSAGTGFFRVQKPTLNGGGTH